MPGRTTIPFVGQHATSKTISVNNQETVNFIHAIQGSGAKAPVILKSAPGLIDVGMAGNGACRTPHMVNWQGELYGVFGRQLASIDNDIVATVHGTLDDLDTPCVIARGRNYVMVVDGAKGYTYDGTTFAVIADLDFPANFAPAGSVTHVTYLDGFFIVNDATTDNWYISGLEDPTSWNALDFEAAAVSPDAALAVIANSAILWVLGDETAQPFYNTGNVLFPYSLILSGVQEVGIAAPYSLAESDEGVFFLATTPEGGLFVYRIRGQQGQIISGAEQSDLLAEIPDHSAVTGYIYKQEDEAFYVMHLADALPSLVYNIKAGLWETRTLLDGSAYRINGHGVVGQARNIGGSRFSARLYEMRLDNYADSGLTFVRRRRTQIYHRNNHEMDWWELVVDMEPGTGLEGDVQGSDPTIRLRYSDDNGATWSAQLEQPIGRQGETEQRAVFRNLGRARNRVFEVEVSDPVNFTIIAAYAVVQVLRD